MPALPPPSPNPMPDPGRLGGARTLGEDAAQAAAELEHLRRAAAGAAQATEGESALRQHEQAERQRVPFPAPGRPAPPAAPPPNASPRAAPPPAPYFNVLPPPATLPRGGYGTPPPLPVYQVLPPPATPPRTLPGVPPPLPPPSPARGVPPPLPLPPAVQALQQQAQAALTRAAAAATPQAQAAMLAQMQAAAAQAQARAQLLATPQGQAALQQMAQAQQAQGRAQMVAQYGTFGAAALQARGAVGRGALAAGIASIPAHALIGLAGEANPQAAATYRGSLDLLGTRLGGAFQGQIEGASRAAQDLAEAAAEARQRRGRLQPGETDVAGDLRDPNWYAEFVNPINPVRRTWQRTRNLFTGGGFYTDQDLGKEKPLLQSYEGLPQARSMGYEQYSAGLSVRGVGTGPLENEILNERMRNMMESLGNTMKDVADNTDATRNFFPTWGRF